MGFDQLSIDYNDVVVRGVLDLWWRGTHYKSEFAYRISENDGTVFEFYNPDLREVYIAVFDGFVNDLPGGADTWDEFVEVFTPPFTMADGEEEAEREQSLTALEDAEVITKAVLDLDELWQAFTTAEIDQEEEFENALNRLRNLVPA